VKCPGSMFQFESEFLVKVGWFLAEKRSGEEDGAWVLFSSSDVETVVMHLSPLVSLQNAVGDKYPNDLCGRSWL
jgi:hypothetical protein